MVPTKETGMLPPTPSFPGCEAERQHTMRISVLYVDEAPVLLDSVCRYLEINGEMMADTSLTAEDAIEKMRYIHYHIIVTDYYSNNGEGYALLRYLRNIGNCIPFVFFVFFRSDVLEEEARRYSNVWFTDKPGSCSGSIFSDLYKTIIGAVKEVYLTI